MLSRAEAMSRIQDGELTVEYALKVNGASVEFRSPPLKLAVEPEGESVFETNYFGNRLSITLGPVIRSNTFRRKRGRKRFRGRNWVFDLRETGGKFVIFPGESITVNSLEYVEMGPRLGALTMPRLSHATAGIVLSPSYIDPLWSGILVYEMTNVSSQPFTLHIGEKIAACHFYEVGETDLTTGSIRKFSDKSHHFGQNWTKIINGDADPFPQKKLPVGTSDDEHLGGGWLRRNWKTILNYVGVMAAIGTLVGIGTVIPEVEEIRQTPTKIAQVDDELEALQQLSARRSLAGTLVVNIPPNATSASRTIDIPLQQNERVAGALVSSGNGANATSVSASVVGFDPGSAQVEVNAIIPASTGAISRVAVTYVIVFE